MNGSWGVNNNIFLIGVNKKKEEIDNFNRGESKNKRVEVGKFNMWVFEFVWSLEYI